MFPKDNQVLTFNLAFSSGVVGGDPFRLSRFINIPWPVREIRLVSIQGDASAAAAIGSNRYLFSDLFTRGYGSNGFVAPIMFTDADAALSPQCLTKSRFITSRPTLVSQSYIFEVRDFEGDVIRPIAGGVTLNILLVLEFVS